MPFFTIYYVGTPSPVPPSPLPLPTYLSPPSNSHLMSNYLNSCCLHLTFAILLTEILTSRNIMLNVDLVNTMSRINRYHIVSLEQSGSLQVRKLPFQGSGENTSTTFSSCEEQWLHHHSPLRRSLWCGQVGATI